ncbi:MAG TPA: ELWxxDGT repeat protein [Chryseosolibacter sp.]
MNKKLPLTPIETDALLYVIISVLLLFSVNQVFSQSHIIKDINVQQNNMYNEYSYLTGAPDQLFFISEGRDLYSTKMVNGVEQTSLIRSFTYARNLYVAGNTLYFAANDGQTGIELWRSDGTAENTVLVKDIYPGSASSNPESFRAVNGTLYFVATGRGLGKEVWKSDGTANGTSLLKDIFPKSGSSNPAHLTVVNGKLFFAANDGLHGYELWVSDGSSSGTVLVKDIRTETKVSSSPDNFAAAGAHLYFVANDPAFGRELWKSDGTEAGTVQVKDIRAGTGTSAIDNTVGVGNILYFTATDGISGQELWRSDGTEAGTYLLKDMTPGSAGSHGEVAFSHKMGNFTSLNGLLFYTAYQGNSYYIWKSDGTAAGTTPIQLCNGPGIGQPRPQFKLMGDHIYYFNMGEDEYYYYALWRMNADGTSPHTIYSLAIDAYDYDYPLVTVANNLLYFSTRADYYTTGFTIFVSNGTTNGTHPIQTDTYKGTLDSSPSHFITLNNKILFTAQIEEWTSGIYSTDGTTEGTIQLAEASAFGDFASVVVGDKAYLASNGDFGIWETDGSNVTVLPQHGSSPATNLQFANGNLFYTNYSGELWGMNAATRSQVMLKDFSTVTAMNPLGAALIIRVLNENNGEELWRTNGTSAGTYRFKTVRTGFAYPSYVNSSATVKNTFYFIANDGIHGNELWRTQGSAASTYMIADLNPNDDAFKVYNYNEFDIAAMTSFRDSLYFSAVDVAGNWSLFKTNGTASGMRKVTNLNAVQSMIAIGKNKLLMFVYRDNDRSHIDLWVTDGTATGTKMLRDFGFLYYPAIDFKLIDGNAYFMLENSIWKSDGTDCGTYPTDLGIYSQREFEVLGGNVIFSGYDRNGGFEPHRFAMSQIGNAPCDSQLSASAFTDADIVRNPESILRQAPNPFNNDFSLTISGKDNEKAHVDVFTMTGSPVESLRDVECNIEYRMGNSWHAGMYIVKVNLGGMIHTEKVIKR